MQVNYTNILLLNAGAEDFHKQFTQNLCNAIVQGNKVCKLLLLPKFCNVFFSCMQH